MTHEASVTYNGDSRRVMQLAAESLTAAGMRIDSKTDSTLEFSGPGLNSTNENPLLGISRARLSATGSTISIRADLGAVQRLFRILLYMIVALDVVACVVLFLVLRGKMATPLVLTIAIAPVAPWIVLLPLMSGWMKRRTMRAIETLLNNLSVAARGESHRTFPQNSSVS
jgi:hypothetical protein